MGEYVINGAGSIIIINKNLIGSYALMIMIMIMILLYNTIASI